MSFCNACSESFAQDTGFVWRRKNKYVLCILVAAYQTLNDKGLEECRNKTARYGSIAIALGQRGGQRGDDRGLIHERTHRALDHLGKDLHLTVYARLTLTVKKTSTSTLPNFLLLNQVYVLHVGFV